jgi:hypothetical protein
MATFHVLSDLRGDVLSFRLDPAQVTEPNLILAGDIAVPSDEYRCSWVTAPSCLERVFVSGQP